MTTPRTPRPAAQRGAAALIVVMLLFFLVSLVAAYAARNMLFEQKTSANQYRATQAFEAAEAGLEWALAMLNGSRIDAACSPLVPPDVSQTSFRQRYLTIDVSGNYTPRVRPLAGGGTTPEQSSCVQSGAGWSCSCPSGAAPTPTLPAGGEIHPAFRVCFEAVNPAQPGVVRVVSTGGTNLATVDRPCDEAGEGTGGEAAASVSVVVALSSALPVPPVAAATAGRDLRLPVGTTATLINTDAQTNGLTAHVGRTPDLGGATLRTLPGTPPQNSSVVDANLGTLAATAPVPLALFASQFRMPTATYKSQPATVVVDCSSDCINRVNDAVQANPGRIVWVAGSAPLNGAALNLGTDDAPAMLVVDGDINFNGSTVNVVGMVYGQQDILFDGATVNVRGAIMAARDIVGNGATATVEYNALHLTQPTLVPPVLTQLRLASGSLVRVPGSWRDFP